MVTGRNHAVRLETKRTYQMDKLTYGDNIAVDFGTLPEASQHALALRGFTHIMGNETASRVHNWAGAEGQANSDDKATIKAWKDSHPAELAAKAVEVQGEFLKALTEGTLGSRVAGPRLQPVDQVARRIAKEQVSDILRAGGIKVPKKDETITTKDGAFTLDQLVDRRLANEAFGPAIKKAAEKEVANRAKAIDAAKANADEAMAAL